MLRLSRLADYGVVLLAHVARNEGLCSARELALETAIPRPTVGKILKDLTRQGILSSRRGVNGGYHLTCATEDLSVLRIIEALDGPLTMTACANVTAGACDHEGHCQLREPWRRINRAVAMTLGKISLADMADVDRVDRRLSESELVS